MTANVCRALLTVFLALCLLSGATASDEFSDALMQDTCVECGSAGEHLESCSLYVIPDIIDDSFDTDIPDIVEEPLNPEFSGDDLSSSDAVSSGDDPSSDLLTGSTEPPVQLSFAEQLLASDDLWGMYSKMLSAMNEDVGILYALTADELVVLKEHANLLYLSIPEPTYEDMENWDGIIATLTVLEESISGTPAAAAVYETGSASSKTTINGDEYICFDLAAGNVEITASKYKGYVFKDSAILEVSGTHSAEKNYYVYQSNPSNKKTTGWVKGEFKLPEYQRVGAPADSGKANWSEYITNNTDVEGIISNWKTEAGEVGRESTSNWISVTGSGTYNITIDNLWSSKQTDAESRSDGGIAFNPGSSGKLTVNLVGDNRFGNIHYCAKSDLGAQIIFESDASNIGTLTVANIESGKGTNHWNSVIGADDGGGDSVGIVINSGIIYAGATLADVCTAIGAGGNGYGHVTINGGTVTAVTASSGTALGGGIAETSYGGIGYVAITGGIVYAYNLGYVSTYSSPAQFIPAAAIGGGSSCNQYGSKGTVLIKGGTVYAQSIGGTAIGGGSSTKNKGGDADITITGGGTVVTACSIGGTVFDMTGGNQKTVQPGAAIGGGTGGNGAGGKATLTISGGQIFTGSIGGGKGKTSTGSAAVNITGGTIIGQVMMEGDGSSFEMTDGVIDNTNSADYNFQKTDGGAVWIQTGKATMSGGTIKNTNAENGGAIYVSGGSFAMSGGNISSTSATANGGAIYVSGGSVSISGGNITDVSAEEGGAVYVAVTGSSEDDSFTISGGTIQNATATKGSGGAVAVANGKASMRGTAVIRNAEATSGDGGAVSVSGGSFAMSGGSIDDVSALNGGAVAVSDGTFTMSDGTIQNSQAIRSESDDTSGNGGAVSVSGAGSVLMSGGSLDSCSAYNGGGVYVNVTDTTVNSFTMNNSAEIRNCTASSNGGAVCVEGGNALMESGSIDGGDSLENAVFGGAVYVKGGSFTMENGVISNSRAGEDGGAVYVEDGSASMLSGTINSSTASSNGGAVSVTGGSFTMSEGTIGGTSEGDCTAENGGAVSVTGGTFTMTSGIIQNSTATADGGAVYVHGGTASVTDGSIRFCSAEDGGAVYVYTTSSAEGDSFIMSGSASVLNCTASEDGGAVCVEGGSARMYDGTIQYCTATLNGGAVSVIGGSFTMDFGDVDSCTASQNGGAVYVSTGDFVMDSGNLTQNTATGDGGGACIVEGSITIGNVICKDRKNETHIHPKTNDNKAANGGAFAVSGGTLTIYCGEYAGNQAVESNSNGLYLTNGTVVVGSGVDADSLLTKDIVITGTTYVYSDSRLDISKIRLYRYPGDNSPVTIPVDLKTYNSIRLNQSLVSGWVSPYPGTVLIGWSTAGTDTNTTVLSNPAYYYPENSKYPIPGGGGVDFYAIWGSAESVLTYTVIIPSVVEIPANGNSGTAIVKVDTEEPFFIPNDVGNVNVTLSSYDGELVLLEKEGQTVGYSLLKEETPLTCGTVVASFAYDGEKNYEEVPISAKVTGEPIYAGTYQDTVTFSLSLEMEDYGDKCYQGGST